MLIPVHGIYPKIHQKCWIAPTAVVIGDVEIGENSTIWFNTVIRGDVHSIRIGKETNIQDNCTLHATYGESSLKVGSRVTVGHQVILHGCEVKDGSLIGMGSVVMDKAVIGENCVVGAGSLVTENSKFENGYLILGSPAKAKRKLNDEELKRLQESADNYITYAGWYSGKGGKIP